MSEATCGATVPDIAALIQATKAHIPLLNQSQGYGTRCGCWSQFVALIPSDPSLCLRRTRIRAPLARTPTRVG